jgi:hypothetical protein
MHAIILYVFLAININAGNSVDGSYLIKTKSLAACEKMERNYNAAMIQMNNENSPAFRLRWTTDCKVMVLSERHKPV